MTRSGEVVLGKVRRYRVTFGGVGGTESRPGGFPTRALRLPTLPLGDDRCALRGFVDRTFRLFLRPHDDPIVPAGKPFHRSASETVSLCRGYGVLLGRLAVR